MSSEAQKVPQNLLNALKSSDDSNRRERAERIIWVDQYSGVPGIVIGRSETLHLLNEARETFVNGHFASALMLAVSVIEHCLVEECQIRELFKNSPPLMKVLNVAEENRVLPEQCFASLRLLVARRNPYAHLKAPTHEHGLGRRVRTQKVHPQILLRQDAEIALKCMYDVFRATLREVDLQWHPDHTIAPAPPDR